jgi:hypothetical protein
MWADDGLSNDAWFILLGNIILPSITSITNPSYLWRLFKRRGIRKNANTTILTQQEANVWFEGPPFDIAQKYANNFNSLAISLFFLPMLPLSLLAGGFAILFAYVSEKFLLYRRYAAPHATGSDLCFGMYRFFDLAMVIFAVRDF